MAMKNKHVKRSKISEARTGKVVAVLLPT